MKKIKIVWTATLLMSVYFSACNKENTSKKDEWIEIDSIMPAVEVSQQLNYIITKQKKCLMIDFDTIFYTVFSREEFERMDTCTDIPQIDFNKYTLTIGGIPVPYFAYKISDIKLFLNDAKEMYSYEISMDTCVWCYTMSDVKYFWKLYPKLNPEYKFKVIIKNVNRL